MLLLLYYFVSKYCIPIAVEKLQYVTLLCQAFRQMCRLEFSRCDALQGYSQDSPILSSVPSCVLTVCCHVSCECYIAGSLRPGGCVCTTSPQPSLNKLVRLLVGTSSLCYYLVSLCTYVLQQSGLEPVHIKQPYRIRVLAQWRCLAPDTFIQAGKGVGGQKCNGETSGLQPKAVPC